MAGYVVSWRDTVDWYFSVITDDIATAIHLQVVLESSDRVKTESIKRERVED